MANKPVSNSKPARGAGKPDRDGGTVTAKSAGIKHRKKYTVAFITNAIRKASEVNRASRNKPNYTDKGMQILAGAIAKAFTLPTLSSEKIGTEWYDAEARRKFAKKHKATLIDTDKVILKSTGDRTENAIRVRLQVAEKCLGLPKGTLVAVRATPYRKGEKSKVFVVCR